MVGAGLIAAVGAVAASASPGLEPQALLDRHRPVLVYDRAEKWRAVSVDDFVESGLGPARAQAFTPPAAEDVVYGRVIVDGERTWLQYWLFFAYNGQDRGIVRTGRHEGDWEVFQVGLGPRRPEVATFSQHSSAAGCDWTELERSGATPRVYVANGSHALYPRRGTHDRPFPDPNDEARGGGSEAAPEVTRISSTSPQWIRLDGRWGASSRGVIPGEQSSPHGPAFSGERWMRPSEFHAGARGCFTAPGGARWAVPALLAAAVAGGCLAVAASRRRHRDAGGPGVTLGA